MIRILKKDSSSLDKENELFSLLKPTRESRIPDVFEMRRGGKVYYRGERLQSLLEDRFNHLRQLGLPLEPIKRFIQNLAFNPSEESREMLFRFLEHNGHPLTENGCFIAYKSVRKNYKDWHTGTIDNSPGVVVSMSRDQVDSNPESTCSSGLHVAAWSYASSFMEDGILIEIEVDPRDVVAVPNDYNGTKMRVCRYRSIGPCERLNLSQLDKARKRTKPRKAKAKSKAKATRRVIKSLSKTKKKKSKARRGRN